MSANPDTVIPLSTQQLAALQALHDAQDYPGAYRLLRDVALDINIDARIAWLDAAAHINANDGSFWSEFVRGSTIGMGDLVGHPITEQNFQQVSDQLARSVIEGVLNTGVIAGMSDIIAADVVSAVRGLGLPDHGWAGTLGAPFLFFENTWTNFSGSDPREMGLQFSQAAAAGYGGLYRAFGLGTVAQALSYSGQKLGNLWNHPFGGNDAPLPDNPVTIGTGTDPNGDGTPDAPTFLSAFNVLGQFQQAAATWRVFRGDPFALDLNGGGIQLIQAPISTANFDLNADGVRERVGWVGPNDGLLALDANGDGKLLDVGELFGSETQSGFAELATYDLVVNGGNNDGKISAADSVFSNLKIWRDINSDGAVDTGELQSVATYDIKSISLAFTPFTQPGTNPGTIITEAGTYELNDGTIRATGDALLERQTLVGNVYNPVEELPSSQDIPDLRGYGGMESLRQATSRDSQLDQEVRTLLSGTPQQIVDGLDGLLFHWAGAQNVSPTSRGGNMDARRLVALETFTGTPFRSVQTGANPTTAAAAILNNAWTTVHEQYAARFLVFGSWFKQIFPDAAYSAATDFLVLNQDVRNVGMMLKNMKAEGDPNADVAISLMPMIYRNSESGRNDLLLFNGAGNSNTTSTVTGVAFSDLGDGTDVLATGALQGLHYTGLGNDTLTFTNGGAHTVINDGGNDTIQSLANGDVVFYALSGNNTVSLKNGSHVISTGAGNDTVNLGSGNHFIELGDGDNIINNVNVVNGVTGTVFIQTGTGNDTIGITANVPMANRMQGDITIRSGDGWKQIFLGHGLHDIQTGNNATIFTNVINLGNGDASIQAGNGNRTITVGNGNHTITTGSGNDTVVLGVGNHTVNLGAGNNSLTAGVGSIGNVNVTTGSGNDTVSLSSGNHSINLGDGDNVVNNINVVNGETGTVFIQTGVGNDIFGTTANVPMANRMHGDITIRSGDGWKQIFLGNGMHDIQIGNNSTIFTNNINLGNGDASIQTGNGKQIINAGSGNHTITVGSGNDSVVLGTGSHTVNLGAGNNSLSAGVGAVGNSNVTAGGGDDTITLGDGNHVVAAGEGINLITLGIGNHTVTTGASGDTIIMGSGSGTVNAGSGNNLINTSLATGQTGTVSITTGVGDDVIGNSAVAMSLRMQGDITIRSGDGWKRIYLGDGVHDIVIGTNTVVNQTPVISLGNGSAHIVTGNGNFNITAGNGNHSISTGLGSQTINLGAGNHTVVTTGSSADILNMGSGNSYVDLGDGNNSINAAVATGQVGTVEIHTGLGSDVIGNSVATMANRMQGNITIRSGDGLKFIYLGHGVHDIQMGVNTTSTISQIQLGDGNATIVTAGGGHAIVAGTGDHHVTTGSGDDVITLGVGNHVVAAGAGTNTIALGAGNHTVTSGAGGDTINMGSGSSYVDAGDGNNQINANSSAAATGQVGTVEIHTGVGSDNIGYFLASMANRMQGNITIRSGDGLKNVYLGHGVHDIQMGVNTTGNVSQIQLGDGSAHIVTAGGGHSIVAGTGDHDVTTGSGDDVINLGVGNHIVAAGAGTNTINLGAGNHTVTSGAGGDTINMGSGSSYVDAGDGNNQINASSFSATGQVGAVEIHTGLGSDNIGYSSATMANRMQGNITIRSGDGLKNVYLGHGVHDIQIGVNTTGNVSQIQLGDGSAHIVTAGGGHSIVAGTGDHDVTTGSGDDVINLGVGNHIVAAGAGTNTINLGAGNHTVTSGAGGDTINMGSGSSYVDAGDGNNQINASSFSATGQVGAVEIHTGLGTDSIGYSSATMANRMQGNITIRSGDGLKNIYLGHGVHDIQMGTNTTGSVSQIQLGDGDATIVVGGGSHTIAAGSGTHSVISGSGADTIDLGSGNDSVSGGGGADTIRTGAGDDTLAGGAGIDRMEGGIGSDTYVFNRGDGQDVASDFGWNASTSQPDTLADTVLFGPGIALSDVTVTQSGASLVLAVADPGNPTANDRLTIENWFTSFNGSFVYRVENLQFSDGTIVPLSEVQLAAVGGSTLNGGTGPSALFGNSGPDTLNGNAGNDFLSSGAGNDSLVGGAGADTLVGGAGNDALSGGTENDLYVFDVGFGQDTLTDTDATAGNLDTVRFGAGISPGSVTVTRLASDLLLSRGTDRITVKDWFTSDASKVERVEFADGTNWNVAQLRNLSNAAPVLAIPIADQSATEDQAFTFQIPGGSFIDADASIGDLLTYSVSLSNGDPLPAWLTFNSATRTFSGTPANGDVGAIALNVTVTDGSNASVSDIFSVTIVNTNDMPTLANSMADQVATENAAFSFQVPSNTFADVDAGDTLAYSATLGNGDALPTWLSFDTSTGTFSGTPTNADVGTLSLAVRATDSGGLSVSDVFNLEVYSSNHAPVLNTPLSDQSAIAFRPFNYIVPLSSFTDSDEGDTLTYSAKAANGNPLPSWLSFNSSTRTFSGNPTNANAGTTSLTVTVTDSGGMAVSDTFDIVVGSVNSITGTEGPDTLNGTASADVMHGLGGADVIDGGLGDDTLLGGSGNDQLYGSAGNDVLDGGAGNDTLTGSAGNDTYVFGRGSGQDTVFETDATAGNVDTVQMGADVLPGDVTVRREGIALTLSINGTTDKLTIQYYFHPTASATYKIEQVTFADGTVWGGTELQTLMDTGTEGVDSLTGSDGNDVMYGLGGADVIDGGLGDDTLLGGAGNDQLYGSAGNDVLDGGAGNDTLTGSAGNDTYVFGRGSGQDTVFETDATAGNVDTVQMGADVLPGDVTVRREGIALTLSINGTTDKLTIQYYFHPTASATYKIEQVTFADGTVWGGTELQTLMDTGTEGVDSLTGSDGNDVMYGLGGADVIDGGLGDDTLLGGAGNDQLYGSAGNDVLDGGAGNDTLTGSAGNDTYVFGRGSGQDTVFETDATAGNVDTVQMGADVLPGDVTVRREGIALTLSINGTTDKLTIQYYFHPTASATYKIEQVTFADGTVWGGTELQTLMDTGTEGVDSLTGSDGNDVMYGLGGADVIDGELGDDTLLGGAGNDQLYGSAGNDVLDGGAGNDTLTGSAGNDTYVFGRGSGQDTVFETDATAGNVDTVQMGADVLPGDVTVRREGIALTLSINGTTDKLTIQYYFHPTASATYKIEQVTFADGTVWGGTELQTLMDTGTEGVDSLTGSDGNDVMYGLGGADVIDGGLGDDTLLGGAGNDQLYGSAGNDVLDGGAGNDTLTGSAGNDTYVFGRGSGQDTVFETDATAGNVDTVQMGADVLSGDVTVRREGIALTLSINGTTDKLTIQYYFHPTASATYKIEQVTFADGTVWGGTELQALIGVGTDAADTLNGDSSVAVLDGRAGNDTLNAGTPDSLLSGGDGADTLNGGTGDDLLAGGAGNDTIATGAGHNVVAVNAGGGSDTVVSETGASNTLSLGGGVKYEDVALAKDGNDLLLKTGDDDSVRLKDWYNGKDTIKDLQLILDATNQYDSNSSDPLYNRKVQTFDFKGLVSQFDQVLAASPGLSSWAITNALLQFHLSGADDAALGGDLAYWYGRNDGFTGIGLAAAQAAIGAPGFGTEAQTLHAFSGLQEGLVKLA